VRLLWGVIGAMIVLSAAAAIMHTLGLLHPAVNQINQKQEGVSSAENAEEKETSLKI